MNPFNYYKIFGLYIYFAKKIFCNKKVNIEWIDEILQSKFEENQ